MIKSSLAFCFALFVSTTVFAQKEITLTGRVLTEGARPVYAARVTVSNGSQTISSVTDASGRFAVRHLPFAKASITVRANGFIDQRIAWTHSIHPLSIILKPAVSESVDVKGDRFAGDASRLSQILTSEELLNSGAVALDDALRQVAGFQLFRRSGSRTANPTSQGVSLRGVGSTGASRALVLYDGIPLNDPFGGWIYWGLIPKEALESVDVFPGGGSDSYGNSALGGIIHLQPARQQSTFSLSTSAGNQGTERIYASGSLKRNDLNVVLQAETFNTAGYFLLEPADRGAADRPAGSDHKSAQLLIERTAASGKRVFLRTGYYGESRNNGTALQINQTALRYVTGGFDKALDRQRFLSVRAFGMFEDFDQQFSIVGAARNSEILASSQHVPSNRTGAGLHYSFPLAVRNEILIGGDFQRSTGRSEEISYLSGLRSAPGGTQNIIAIFAQDRIRISEATTLQMEGRIDTWKNIDRSTTEERSEIAWSPRISLVHDATARLQLRGAFYTAFRAPTLNELYRPFRLGNIFTLNNPDLRSEKLKGAEAGLRMRILENLEFQSTFFHMQIANAIGNITLSSTPDLIRRQRINFGDTRSTGLEINTQYQPVESLRVRFGYQYADAIITASQNSQLKGLAIPQVPRHQFTFALDYGIARDWNLALQGRSASEQFDDDLNRLPLDPFFLLDAVISYRIRNSCLLFLSFENLLNNHYPIGKVPYTTFGSPRLLQAGLRFTIF